jgi:hypothetical protein
VLRRLDRRDDHRTIDHRPANKSPTRDISGTESDHDDCAADDSSSPNYHGPSLDDHPISDHDHDHHHHHQHYHHDLGASGTRRHVRAGGEAANRVACRRLRHGRIRRLRADDSQ